MERYTFRLGAVFEMPPHSGREANRARNGRAGLHALPGPAPSNVNGNPFRRDSKGVWSATDLGLVEVHLGHLTGHMPALANLRATMGGRHAAQLPSGRAPAP